MSLSFSQIKAALIAVRRPLVFFLHAGFVVSASYAAFWLRFDGEIPPNYAAVWLRVLPWLVAIRLITFAPFGLYHGLWRYTGIWDLRNIILAVGTGTLVHVAWTRGVLGEFAYPRSAFVIEALLLVCALGGIRLARRIYREFRSPPGERRVLIVGAGDAAEMLVRDMRNDPTYRLEPVGFLDDDPKKVGMRIHGVPVLGTRADVDRVMASSRPHEVLVAMPSMDPATIRSVVADFQSYKVPIKTLPRLSSVVDGNIGVSSIRSLRLEDLLQRSPVGLDLEPVRAFLKGKRVMVTGAGGSIGSEICRQVASYDPAELVMLEKAESALYEIDNELKATLPDEKRIPCLANLRNRSRIEAVFERRRPEIVFHAAAYKHVPMMEQHPEEGVLNNVRGTRRLAEVAVDFGVETFILISTDKAANPSSVMGATKRLCERVIQGMAARGSATTFGAVRFGNVLGSNGSVVPLFVKQIEAGGPVTVTHKDVRRFFMTIPEAVQLVLRAAPLARSGEIFALDMGEQISVLEVARHLIRLSGKIPEVEIPIEFVGLRPGEKLEEELVADGEGVESSGVEKIFRVVGGVQAPGAAFDDRVRELEATAETGDRAGILRQLVGLVPSFHRETTPADDASPAVERVLAIAK